MPIKLRVSDLLGERKMTQKQLSEKTGIRAATINKFYHETVKRLELDQIEKLCEAFECTPGDLLVYLPRKKGKTLEK